MTTSPGLSAGNVELSATKRELMRQRLRRSGPAAPRIPRRPDDAAAPPLSYAQERLWFMEQFVPGTGAYTVPLCLRLHGPLDVDLLRRAVTGVTARHDVLRFRFPPGADGVPRVEVDPVRPVDVPLHDLTAAGGTPAQRERSAREFVAAESARAFDLREGPLLRAVLLRLDAADHVLLVTTHHTVSDGWSTDVLADDLLALYAAYAGDSPPALPELPVRYGDYAVWQRERVAAGGFEASREYWRRQLAGLSPLELPVDHPRGAEQTFVGASHHFRLDRPLLDAVQRVADRVGATLYMTMLAAYQVLLLRHTGQTDFAVGSPVAGRPLPELERLVGMFVNMLPMRATVADDPTFVELVARVRDTALAAWSHQDLPFEQVVQELDLVRDPSRSPVFQTVLVLQPSPVRQPVAGPLTATRFPFDLHATRYDLELYAFPSADGLECMFVYNSDLFTPERVGWLSGHLTSLLASAAARPDTAVSRLDMLTAGELADAARRNDTAQDLGPPTCLHRLVTEQAARTPDAVAVRDARTSLTYAELDRRVRRLAGTLVAAGVRRGDLVAVVMERGAEQVVATVAIQLAGAAYLPVDPDLPEPRRRHLLERGRCRLALTQPWLGLDWPPDVRALVLTDDGPVDAGSGEPVPAAAGADPVGPAGPDDLAYVIFTSGSTGDPKGVMIDHRAAVNTVRDVNRRFGVGPDDRVLAVSALSFDLSVYDIFGLLAAGGTLVMPEPAAAKDPAAWARWVGEHRVTVWDSVPALMELLVEHAEQDGADLTSLRLVLLSGDWIPLDLPDRIRAIAPHARVISLGGATEGAIWSICHPVGPVDPAWRSIPYGTPMANQSFHILDRHGAPVPVGVTGELHIGGAGVARGYWRDPERTAASFVRHPVTGERLYRTGDLGRYRPDGVIEFLGRVDSQVKIRGYRIELGEIEAHLARCPGVADCVVTVRRHDGEQVLVAYVVPGAGAAPGPADLRGHLAGNLAAYMVPSHYVLLPRLPLTGNGKVDRKRLPDPGAASTAGATRDVAAPGTPTERVVAEVFQQTLGVATLGLDDNFFDLGGHSIAAIQTVTRLRRALSGDPDGAAVFGVTDLFRHPTVREFAALVDRAADGPGDDAPAPRMLHRLTRPSTRTPAVTYVCVPYGGGQPTVYQPLADALPADRALYAVAIPGHDPTRPDEVTEPIEVVARRCADEIAGHVDGPLVLYGHCGIGGALAVETARCLEADGRDLVAVCVGGIFPFARPAGRIVGPLSKLVRYDRLGGDRAYENRLRATGGDVEGLEPEQVTFMIRSLRRDSRLAEDYFTRLLASDPVPLRAPVVSVVGERDVATDFYAERFREWHFLAGTTALVVLDEAGHYFLRYRAEELAEILTGTPGTVAAATSSTAHDPDLHGPGRGEPWWLQSVSVAGSGPEDAPAAAPQPGLGRFLAVASSQLVSFTGTALTDFALPLWVYLTTGSLAQFAIFMMLAIVPGVFVAPLIGALVDRSDRRRVMIAGSAAAGAVQLVLGLLVWTDNLAIWHTYPLVTLLSVALTAHRLGYTTAVPQLVPKQYLGHANGVVQLANGIAQFVAPLGAAALLATIGLGGILVFDLVSFAVGIVILLATRFPDTMAYTPREPLATEISQGFRLSLGNRSFRALIVYFALLNILLAPLLMSLLPLSLSFGDLSTAATVSFVGGAGAALGGLVVALWGGPARRRVRGMLLVSLLFGVFGALTGVHPSVLVVGLGAFGLWGTLSVVNGIYLTIVHVKLPQRFHGRVIALNQAVAWSTLPLGFAVVAPVGERVLQPLLTPDGALAPTVGAVIGTGPGRGLGLLYILLGVAVLGLVVAATRIRTLRDFDDEVPDADPDDLVGARTVRQRTAGAAPAADRERSANDRRA